MQIPRFKAVTAIAVAGMAVFACGSTTSSGGGTAAKGTIKIGVDLPESGAEASNGIPTLNGVKFAVQQAGTVDGFTLAVDNHDDAPAGAHDPAVGANNVRAMIADSTVLGMIGPFNSSVAKVEIPIANAASLAMISPANTNPCLTKDIPACHTSGGYLPADLRPSGTNNYFRVAATDDHQGSAMADYIFKTLNVTKIGVVDDAEIYGKGLADAFAAQFTKDGGTVVDGVQDVDTKNTASFSALLNKFKTDGATAVYFGGTDSNKGCVIRQQSKGIFDSASSVFGGGDGIVTTQCLSDAGDQVGNMYGSIAAVDATKLPGAQATIAAFKAAYAGANDFGGYTMPAYAATKVLIAAIKKAIEANGGNMPSRAQVVSALGSLAPVDTPLGPTSFDSNGDTTQQIITIYQTLTTGGSDTLECLSSNNQICWKFVTQVAFK